MRIFKLLLFLAFSIYFSPAVGQTDPTVVTVDTAFRTPGVSTSPADTTPQQLPRIKKAKFSAKTKKDTVVKDSARLALERLPRQAALGSAVLPGLGQIRNHRWWKVPLIYGGFVSLGLVYNFNNQYYHDILKEVQYREENKDQPNNPKYAQYSQEALITAKDFYRRNRDLSILGAVAFHAIQIIDAYVDAKFFRYDIGDELTFKVGPSVQSQPTLNAYTPYPAIKLSLSL